MVKEVGRKAEAEEMRRKVERAERKVEAEVTRLQRQAEHKAQTTVGGVGGGRRMGTPNQTEEKETHIVAHGQCPATQTKRYVGN